MQASSVVEEGQGEGKCIRSGFDLQPSRKSGMSFVIGQCQVPTVHAMGALYSLGETDGVIAIHRALSQTTVYRSQTPLVDSLVVPSNSFLSGSP